MQQLAGSEVLIFIVGQLFVGAAIWGGIRADIRAMHERINAIRDTANQAHERIDTILGNNGNNSHARRAPR